MSEREEAAQLPAARAQSESALKGMADVLAHGDAMSVQERRARERIMVDRYDTEAWNMLGSEAQGRPIAEAASLYELLLTNFPTAARYWRAYVEAQMMANNDEATKQIFSRCLLSCLHVDLWRCYIRFIRKVNENRGAEGRDETKKAFDFMLGHIGMDIGAGAVWMEYIAFLKATPEESQRMTAVRKAYQRAILAPIHLVEQLWKDYENFENSVSRALAKSLLAEYQPKHFSARAVYRERKKLCERIDSSMLAVPPTGSIKEEQQCSAWKQLLAFEKGNPQMLDATSLTKRVAFTFEQCLMCLYHYPEIWYDYASWHAQNGSPESAAVVFQRALKALPDKTLLHYAFAEFEEARGNIQEAKKVYENLVKNTATASSLAYIQSIRFVQRTEGTESALKALVEARKSPLCTYHVYVASAMMVLCIEKDQKIARNIFEMGLKKYIHEPAYVLEYADFLCRLNDDQNVRALFERALSVLPPEESVEVWNRFVLFEQTYGDLSSMLKVQQRRKDALVQIGDEGAAMVENSLQQLISRYRYLDLWPCSAQDLDHLARQQVMAQKLAGKAGKNNSQQATIVTGAAAKGTDAAGSASANIVLPDVSKMVVYDPRQAPGSGTSGLQTSVGGQPLLGLQLGGAPGVLQQSKGAAPSGVPGLFAPVRPRAPTAQFSAFVQPSVEGSTSASVEEAVKVLPPTLGNFLSQLPIVDGPTPNIEMVMAELLQLKIPLDVSEVLGTDSDGAFVAKVITGDTRGQTAGNGFAKPGARNMGNLNVRAMKADGQKRKELDRQEEEDNAPVQNRTPDVFRLRQLQRARAAKSGQTVGGAGSTSGGSGAITGEPSGSSG
ncbi:hypothetical protein GOP47_0025712 [Adiantum capillus-veneris]|uniref:Suppressor of forked domain-containing protein n=1 Tax=Adiantum capillus-veneris TaxID=13818 RepID=A0A9D4Z2F2_ADICA|nr:hypothetical protein GOP47_0025712 [Adiantum capillus-veneris]